MALAAAPGGEHTRFMNTEDVFARNIRARTARSPEWIVTVVVTVAAALVLVVMRGIDHVSGSEIDGVIVGGIALATGILALAYLAIGRPNRAAHVALLTLWIGVALGGLGGYADHRAAFSDLRPPPAFAPLVFVVLGIVGANALVLERRRRARTSPAV